MKDLCAHLTPQTPPGSFLSAELYKVVVTDAKPVEKKEPAQIPSLKPVSKVLDSNDLKKCHGIIVKIRREIESKKKSPKTIYENAKRSRADTNLDPKVFFKATADLLGSSFCKTIDLEKQMENIKLYL